MQASAGLGQQGWPEMLLDEREALGGTLHPLPGLPGQGYSTCGPLVTGVCLQLILTHGDTAWKSRVGTKKLL